MKLEFSTVIVLSYKVKKNLKKLKAQTKSVVCILKNLMCTIAR